MKIILTLAALISACLASDVLDLGDSNFKDGVANQDIMLVEFFAPWCGHCKRLAPEYETAATTLKSNDPPVLLAKVDCTEAGKETCSQYGVSGYPTLKIFRGGEMSADYDGPRDSAGIVTYMKKNAGPSSITLKDAAHFKKKMESAEDMLVVGFFSEESDLYKQYMKVADQKRSDFAFAHSLDADINKDAGHENEIVLFKPKHLHAKFEEPKEILNDQSATAGDIVRFIDEKQVGLVGHMTPPKEAFFKKPQVVVYYNIDWKRDMKGSRYWRNRVARVAKKFVGEIHFAIASRSDYSRQLSDLALPESKDAVHAVAKNIKGQQFRMSDSYDKFDVANLEKFVVEFKEDKLKPFIKSEPIPENNDGPVKVVVGETFDEIVNDPTKDVLVEFYAPWCGHCKTLEPKFNELGEKLAGVKDVVIAKVDATANGVPPPYDVQGFPTLYWAPMGSKDSPKKYQGGREVNDFIDFIKREATNPVVLEDGKKKKKKAKTDL